MKKIVEEIKPKIISLIQKEKIDSVIFVPPTIKREVQFMKVLEKKLNLELPVLKVEKIKTTIIVPQKTLKKIKDREENARATFEVLERTKYKKTLIIDDAVGSGATINEIACKILDKKITKNIIGLSIVGSLNGFEVINEI
jgi:predicted amidophosphoribosyltransferase